MADKQFPFGNTLALNAALKLLGDNGTTEGDVPASLFASAADLQGLQARVGTVERAISNGGGTGGSSTPVAGDALPVSRLPEAAQSEGFAFIGNQGASTKRLSIDVLRAEFGSGTPGTGSPVQQAAIDALMARLSVVEAAIAAGGDGGDNDGGGVVTPPGTPPTLDGNTVESGAAGGTVVGQFSGSLVELVDGAGGRFAIDSQNRLIATNTATDATVATSHTVVVTRGGQTYSFVVQVNPTYASRVLGIASVNAFIPLGEAHKASDGPGIRDVKRNLNTIATFKIGPGIILGRPSLVKDQPSRRSAHFASSGQGNMFGDSSTVSTGLDKTGTAAFSFGCYFHPSVSRGGNARDYAMFSKRRIGSAAGTEQFKGWEVGLRWTGQKTIPYFIISAGSTDKIEVVGNDDIGNSPAHLIVTYDGSKAAAGVNIYVNNTAQAKTVVSGTLTNSAATVTAICIAGRPGGDGSNFDGRIAEMVFATSVLSASERGAIAQPVAPIPTQLPHVAGAPSVILDTDLGGDSDDVASIACLNGFENLGQIRLIAAGSSRFSAYGAPALEGLMLASGIIGLPIGANLRTSQLNGTAKTDTEGFGQVVAQRAGVTKSRSDYEDAVRVYRRALAASSGGVLFMVIGGYTNVARLLQSTGDDISSLTGMQLVTQKVARFGCMGGNYSAGNSEHNIQQDPGAADYFARNVPVPCIWGDYILGDAPQAAMVGNPDVDIYRFALEAAFGGALNARVRAWDLHPIYATIKGVPNDVHPAFAQTNGSLTVAANGAQTWSTTPGMHSVLQNNPVPTAAAAVAFDNICQWGAPQSGAFVAPLTPVVDPQDPTPQPQPSTRLFGAYNRSNPTELTDFENWLGKRTTIGSAHGGQNGWADTISSAGWATGEVMKRVPLVMTTAKMLPDSQHGATLAQAASGAYDNNYRQQAEGILARHSGDANTQYEIIIRTGEEDNGSWMPWNSQGGRKQVFIDTFRRMWQIYKSVSPRFEFCHCPNYGQDNPDLSWPGNAYVKYIGLDFYYRPNELGNNATTAFNAIKNHAYGLDWFKAYCVSKGKIACWPEWGCSAPDALAQTYYNHVFDYIAGFPALRFHVYWNERTKPERIDNGTSVTNQELVRLNAAATFKARFG